MASNQGNKGQFQKGEHWRSAQSFSVKEYLISEYVEKRRSTGDIAKEFDVTDAAILFWLRRHGIPRRSVSEARQAKHWGADGEANPMYGKLGQLNPHYKHGATPERQKMYSRYFWKQIVRVVHDRDKCCVRCSKSEKLITHHLKSWTTHPEARYDLALIVTVCEPCHLWIHSKRNVNREFLLP